MDTKVLSKIIKNVKFRTKILENGKKEYTIERKSSITGEWDIIARTTNLERALIKKHNAWMAEIHFMYLTNKVLNRRKYGKIKFLGIKMN
jgi:hypothetical protein